ncbi:hypothetical protein AeMF1_019179 [Aphanomyces euteiches]|nr:hypothetical protein AeMF1_019179 [Aphanomyces euteiches]KAH9187356.1 hypothetical protein AeNC1_010671 [Aphanomyces euteiches]
MSGLVIQNQTLNDTEKRLALATAELIDAVSLLEQDLARRKKHADPHFVALIIAKAKIATFEQENKELETMLADREELKAWLADWVDAFTPKKGEPNYMELTLLQDDQGRRRGSSYMTNRTHLMSQKAYPYKPFGNSLEDITEVKCHLGEDEYGVCIKAFESYAHFTVEGNFEDLAKAWRFDLTESTPAFSVMLMDKMDDDILYIIHELHHLKLKRISVSGVFPGYPGQERVTVTHSGIAVDERFPFHEGESRANGFQWIIFEKISDSLTLVRWSLVNFCPVNANGPLSLHETARSFNCPVNRFDSDEFIVERIRHTAEMTINKFRDQFRHRSNQSKLDGSVFETRDYLVEPSE